TPPLPRQLTRHPKPPPFPYTTLFRSRTASAVRQGGSRTGRYAHSQSWNSSMKYSDITNPELRDAVRQAKGSRTTTATSDKPGRRLEEHTSELQSRFDLVCRLLLEKKK